MTEVRGLIMMCATATEDTLVDFVERHADIISMFRVTTPVSVLNRIRHLLGPNGEYAVGTEMNFLGGDAQVATQVVLHDVGAALIFRDPIGASGAACDCDALLRLINVHNIINATNSASAEMLIEVLREGMTTSKGVAEVMPSFYETLESPSVAAYKAKQNAVIASHGGAAPAAPIKAASPAKVKEVPAPIAESHPDDHKNDEDWATAGSSKLGLFKRRNSSVLLGESTGAAWNWAKARKLRAAAKAVVAFRAPNETSKHMKQAEGMRCLALISHNNMKGAMKEFVIKHKEVLKRFRLTGTNSTMTMLKSVLGTEGVVYGPTCSSGPLGGDAEVGALMCVEDLGGMFFFTDPLDPHPHAADINALIRMNDLHNLMHASNPSTGDAFIRVLKKGLTQPEFIPTFYGTSMSPAIAWHKTNPRGSLYQPPPPSGPFASLLKALGCTQETGAAIVAVAAMSIGVAICASRR